MNLDDLIPTFRSKVRGLVNGATRWPFYVWSKQTGTGKTTAALMLLDRAYGPSEFDFVPQIASDVMWGMIDYRRFPNFLDGCTKNAYAWNSYAAGGPLTEAKVWNTVAKCPLLVVDDVGELPREAEKFGHDHRGLLKQILDLRCNKPTIITGNLSPWASDDGKPPELLRVLDTGGIDRINDRIVSGTVFEMPGAASLRRGNPQ